MSKQSISQFLSEHWQALLTRTAEHLAMAEIATISALLIGVLLSVLTYRKAYLRAPLLTVASILQTIPGIALLVIIMTLLHRIGAFPAILTLILFALLPIIQNTLVALGSISPQLTEVAQCLGMTHWQRLRYIGLPLALPHIAAGVRIAAVQTIGLATLAAFVGAGGLGQFINRGLFLSDSRLIMLGAIPAAFMAIIIDRLICLVEISVTPQWPFNMRRIARLSSACIIVLLVWFTLLYAGPHSLTGTAKIVVGSKNFTEQLIIAEVVAQQIEQHTHFVVERRFGLGGSNVLHNALAQGTVDVAVEYSGTALISILHHPLPPDRTRVMPLLRELYEQRYGLTWLDPLGFNNSYGLAVRNDDARFSTIKTITQLAVLAPRLEAAFDFEFAERPDGYPGLQHAYNLQFKQIHDMHPDLMYDALAGHEADVISAYTTDGRLERDGIRILQDDKIFFPPYQAAIIVSPKLINANPDLAKTLNALSGRLSDERMRMLNAAVDSKKMTIEQAASMALSQPVKEVSE